MCGCTYVIAFLCLLGGWLTPSPYSIKRNPLVYQSLPVSSIVYPFELGLCLADTVKESFCIRISGSSKLSWLMRCLS